MDYQYWLYPLIWIWVSAVLLLTTFVLYVAIMKMNEVRDTLFSGSVIVRWTCFALLALGLASDTLLNWWFLTITYCELPREFLSTARIRRHKFKSSGFRQVQSLWWCDNWLTPFDIGHCKED